MKSMETATNPAAALASLTPAVVVNYCGDDTRPAALWNYGAELANRTFAQWGGGGAGLAALEREIADLRLSGADDRILAALECARTHVVTAWAN